MPKYVFPAKEGVIAVEGLDFKGIKVKSWNSFGNTVIVETNKELKGFEDYKVE